MIDKILKALRVRLNKVGHIDWDLWCVDDSSVRASRSAAGASKRSKNSGANGEITRRAAAEAGGDQSSTWSLTVTAFPLPCSSPRSGARVAKLRRADGAGATAPSGRVAAAGRER